MHRNILKHHKYKGFVFIVFELKSKRAIIAPMTPRLQIQGLIKNKKNTKEFNYFYYNHIIFLIFWC